jgi:hypothetical protein
MIGPDALDAAAAVVVFTPVETPFGIAMRCQAWWRDSITPEEVVGLLLDEAAAVVAGMAGEESS